MATLGELERAVMELLWEHPSPMTAYELQDALAAPRQAAGSKQKLAATTVLTVLARLEKKHFVTRDRTSRPHHFSPASSREDYMAELMHEVLGSAADRVAVLERFVGQASSSEAAALREFLDPNDD